MAKDKRAKGCTNSSCIKFGKKVLYNASDNFCVQCGAELTFVCKNCFSKLADEGPSHTICAICQAAIDDRKANAEKRRQHFMEQVGAVAKQTASTVRSKAGDAADKVAEGTKKVGQFMEEKVAPIKDDIMKRRQKPAEETDTEKESEME